MFLKVVPRQTRGGSFKNETPKVKPLERDKTCAYRVCTDLLRQPCDISVQWYLFSRFDSFWFHLNCFIRANLFSAFFISSHLSSFHFISCLVNSSQTITTVVISSHVTCVFLISSPALLRSSQLTSAHIMSSHLFSPLLKSLSSSRFFSHFLSSSQTSQLLSALLTSSQLFCGPKPAPKAWRPSGEVPCWKQR